MPVLKRLAPLSTHSSPSRTAVVSRYVASEPWLGSVRPNASAAPRRGCTARSAASARRVPNSWASSTVGKLPTIDASLCGSLCSPIGLRLRCSRTIAIARFAGAAAAELRGQGVAQQAGLVGAARRLVAAGAPTRGRDAARSKSVRAISRRWSKKRALSPSASSGAISRSMKASISSSRAVTSSGIGGSWRCEPSADGFLTVRGSDEEIALNGRYSPCGRSAYPIPPEHFEQFAHSGELVRRSLQDCR